MVTGRSIGSIAMLIQVEYDTGRFATVAIPIKSGQNVEYLQDACSRGHASSVLVSVIDAAPCPNQQPNQFRTRLEPITEWWIHVVVSQNAVGWVLVSEATVKEVDREG